MSQRESGKGRGRPTGTFGSSLLRRSLQREFDEENDADSVSAVSARPGRPRKQDSLENSDLTDGHSGQVRALLLQQIEHSSQLFCKNWSLHMGNLRQSCLLMDLG